MLPDDASNIDIIANDVYFEDESDPKSEWNIVWRHPESGHGHDKSKAILPYRDLEDPPTLFFCGDGVSGKSPPSHRNPAQTADLSAARHADLLFAKEMENGDSDLLVYCKREGIPHVTFKDL